MVIFCEGEASELTQAFELARRHGIGLAVSNPCFELWLILHLQEQTGFLTTAEAERRSRLLDGRAGKRIDPDRYVPHRQRAAQRALALADRHTGNGTPFPKDNPCSTMTDLLVAIEPNLLLERSEALNVQAEQELR